MSDSNSQLMSPDALSTDLRRAVKSDTEELRQSVVISLQHLGYDVDETGRPINSHTDSGSKDDIRELHSRARELELKARQEWIYRSIPRYLPYFASGCDIQPDCVAPVLVEVTANWQHELFRIARLTWSLPFSKGYGRRLRFLIMDEHNGKLIGILALQSPPLSFPARDHLFKYPTDRKTELVNQTMDIQTLGAVPPYARLLGGKLIAMAAVANEVREAYRRKYQGKTTEMAERVLPADLVALTTTSAFGRSSLYNRLVFGSERVAVSIGYTEGYGSFHLAHLYDQFCAFLKAEEVSTRGGFGVGPRIKWQTMVRALERLGFSSDVLKHGVQREAFLFPLISNLKDYMEGQTTELDYFDRPFAVLAEHWRTRWLLDRAERVDGWRQWQPEELVPLLILSQRDQHGVRGDDDG